MRVTILTLTPAMILASATTLPLRAEAQTAGQVAVKSDMVDHFARGRTVILEAIEAVGGAQALLGLTGISYRFEGDVFNDIQGYSAARIGNPARDGVQRIVNRIDVRGARFAQEVEQTAVSGYNSRFGLYWRDGVQVSSRAVPSEFSRTENAPSPFAAGGSFMVSSRWLPPIILQRAFQNMRSVSWTGDGQVDGMPADIVEFSFDEQVRFRVYVARSDHLIRRVETMAPDPVIGDDTTIALLSGVQKVGPVHFPTNIIAIRRGVTNQTLALKEIAISPAFAESDFAPPPAYRQVSLPSAPPRAHHVAGRVYEVRGLAGGTYQVPFVIMDDFVVAFEAPLGITVTRQVISEIKKVVGDKPIRYAVISHFHADHAGGVGAYAEIGATILSSPSNREVLETYAANNRPRLQGLEGPRRDVRLTFEPVGVKGKTIVDAEGRRLEIIDFAQNSHVENMLALYEPDSRIFMGADHHINAIAWNSTFQRTADWFGKQQKAVLLLGTHDAPISRDTFLARARANRSRLKQAR